MGWVRLTLNADTDPSRSDALSASVHQGDSPYGINRRESRAKDLRHLTGSFGQKSGQVVMRTRNHVRCDQLA
jgi:hypothetical protein